MFKSSTRKFLFFLLPIFALSCNVWQTGEPTTQSPTPSSSAEIKSEIPFSTKEPETYQMEIINQTYDGDVKSERRILMARNGARRVTVFNYGEKNLITHLELTPQVTLLIYYDKRIYTEVLNDSLASRETASDFLTTEWLNQKTPSTFESLETENNLSKYQVRLGDATNSNSEILIYVDENLKLPVKQEFYSVSGDRKDLTSSIEVKNFKSEPDEKLFELPKDYRKVSMAEFQEFLWKERTKNE